MERQLGTYSFLTLFSTILTDRGSEFGNPEAPENGICGIVRSSIYFCDPMRSGQKGGIEQAHTMLRMVLPKKTSFEFLTQWDLRTTSIPLREKALEAALLMMWHLKTTDRRF